MKPPFRIERLDEHDRRNFDCGVDALNDYFRRRVGQDMRRGMTACFVAVDAQTGRLAAYNTLAACGIALPDLPADITKKLPRYPSVPAVRLGRLAVDLAYRGLKLGGVMLFDALQRTCRSGIAAYALVVDAKDVTAVEYYEHHGFIRFRHEPQTLFLPISAAIQRWAGG
ncbi:MAG: GNAT family N-acetyltransferase [Planctomycetes bacterium]|nr:GNAT family N-acetyltransferase [Planctomycetota bacterium]